ncbi:MAG: hypothetical protein IT435_18550 [Phycisphaerales bacterium]|nr:hypothetical protein [Phycisphaerales bacterium]
MNRRGENFEDGQDGSFDQVDSLRLMEAVDAALTASIEIAEYTGQDTRPYPADLMGTSLQPACLAPFTLYEIEQASQFLRRMDEVGPSCRAKRPAA